MYMTETNSIEIQERTKIVRACLTHVPFDGWTQKSLELAANDCGFQSTDIARILPRGVTQAI